MCLLLWHTRTCNLRSILENFQPSLYVVLSTTENSVFQKGYNHVTVGGILRLHSAGIISHTTFYPSNSVRVAVLVCLSVRLVLHSFLLCAPILSICCCCCCSLVLLTSLLPSPIFLSSSRWTFTIKELVFSWPRSHFFAKNTKL